MGKIFVTSKRRPAQKMKVLFTFALSALIFAVVNGDVTKCPDDQGFVQKQGGGTECVECKKEDPAATTGCGHTVNEVTRCQQWKGSGYCENDHVYAHIVQPRCLYICEICTE